MLAGCNRVQSTLAPFGAEAGATRDLTVVLVAAAVAIFAFVLWLAWRATRAPEGELSLAGGMRMIWWLGGAIPAIVLFALLAATMPAMRPIAASPADLRIHVTGEQFWWRVAYRPPGATEIVTANEIRLPVGRAVRFDLDGGDVVHSLWIPGLAGKMDLLPGRTNTLVVRAEKPGTFRGQCTEFCGLSHALMAFDVVAMPPAAFDRWLADQARPAIAAGDAGARLFAANGCGGCHAIRGTGHAGDIGPDLSRFGSRRTLAAAVLPMTPANVATFVKNAPGVKPGVRMPAYVAMSDAQADAIARYLATLK